MPWPRGAASRHPHDTCAQLLAPRGSADDYAMSGETTTDDILLAALRQSGVELDERLASVKQLETEQVVAACARCVNLIHEARGVAERFGESMPANPGLRFRSCTTLAAAICALGYPEELGFNHFLYPSEAETRRLLLYLVGALPRADESTAHEQGAGGGGMARLVGTLRAWQRQPWVPADWRGTRTLTEPARLRVRAALRDAADAAATSQRAQEALLRGFGGKPASAAEGLARSGRRTFGDRGDAGAEAEADAINPTGATPDEPGSAFRRRAAFGYEEGAAAAMTMGSEGTGAAEEEESGIVRLERAEDAKLAEIIAEIEEVDRAIEGAKAEHAGLVERAAELASRKAGLVGETAAAAKAADARESEVATLGRAVAMLGDVPGAKRQLASEADEARRKLAATHDQFETHRAPLAAQLAAADAEIAERRADAEEKLTRARRLREEMGQMVASLQSRDAELARLQARSRGDREEIAWRSRGDRAEIARRSRGDRAEIAPRSRRDRA